MRRKAKNAFYLKNQHGRSVSKQTKIYGNRPLLKRELLDSVFCFVFQVIYIPNYHSQWAVTVDLSNLSSHARGGGGGMDICMVFQFLSCFGLQKTIDFDHFGQK